MKKKIILLYSGGLDSSILLLLAQKLGYIPRAILIDYGQVHIAELSYAKEFCDKHKVKYQVMKIEADGISSKLTKGDLVYEGVSQWYVPARNMMFVSLAASIAESLGIDLIWYGAMYGDRENLFPDCYQEWVYKMNELLAINGSRVIKLEAPLLGFSKATLIEFSKLFKINKNEIFSGYGN